MVVGDACLLEVRMLIGKRVINKNYKGYERNFQIVQMKENFLIVQMIKLGIFHCIRKINVK